MKTKILATMLSFAIVAMLVLAGPANAFNFITSNIPDTNKGADVKFTVDISDIDKKVEHSMLVIESTGASLDKIVCHIENDGTYSCVRYKGSLNNPKPYNAVEITQNGDFGYGYGYGSEVSFDVVWHTGTDHQPAKYQVYMHVMTDDSNHVESAKKYFNLITPSQPGKKK